MLKPFLNRLFSETSAKASRRSRSRAAGTVSAVESLEVRSLLTTIQWIGGTGDWGVAANWSGGVLPGANDDVQIGVGSVVTLSSGTRNVRSILNDGTLNITGGSVSVGGNLTGAGGVNVSGGTLSLVGTNWTSSTTLSLSSTGVLNLGGSFIQAGLGTFNRTGGTVNLTGTLTGGLTLNTTTGSWAVNGGTISGGTVTTLNGTELTSPVSGGTMNLTNTTVVGTLRMLNTSGSVVVRGDLTLDGTLFLNGGGLRFNDSSSASIQRLLTNSAAVIHQNATGASFAVIEQTGVGHSVSFGSGVTIRGNHTIIGSGNLAGSWTFASGSLLSADVNNSEFRLVTPGVFVNQAGAVWEARNGGHLQITGAFTNNGQINQTSSTLTINPSGTWSNAATITGNGGSTNLGGSFTQAGLGTFNRTGGTVSLTGTLTGGLTLNTTTGSWAVNGGTISGGTVTTLNGTELTSPVSGGTMNLTNTTVVGTLRMLNTSGSVVVRGDLTLDGTLFLNAGSLRFNDSSTAATQRLLTTTTAVIHQNSSANAFATIEQTGVAHSVTIGSGVTIKGNHTIIGSGAFGGVWNFAPGSLLSSDIANGEFRLTTPGSFVNEAGSVWEARNGGILTLTGSFTNNGQIIQNSSTLTIGSSSFSNAATITMNGGTTNLNGMLNRASLGTFHWNLGQVNISGQFSNNVGTEFRVDGNLNVTGTIIGGSFRTTAAGRVSLNGGTADGITLAGLGVVQENASVRGGLVLPGGQLQINATKTLTFRGSNQILRGEGTVVFPGTGASVVVESNRQLSIGAGITIVGSTGTNSFVATAGTAKGISHATVSRAAASTIAFVGNWEVLGRNLTIGANPDGGALEKNTLVPGRISVVGEVDEWTLFGRVGEALTIAVNPASGPTPGLGQLTVELVRSNGTVVSAATSVVPGETVRLTAVALPADDTYRIRIKAPAALPSAVGHYLITAFDATLDSRPLILNQDMKGRIEAPYRVDRWTFTPTAGETVQLRPVALGSSSLRFSLSGPSGFIGFAGIATLSEPITLPATGQYTVQVESLQTGFGAYTFRVETVTPRILTLGNLYSGNLAGSGEAQLFRVTTTTAQALRFTLETNNNGQRIEVYTKLGSPPSRKVFDGSANGTQALRKFGHSMATAGEWYVLVYGATLSAETPFTLRAESDRTFVNSMTPSFAAVSAGQITVEINGLGLRRWDSGGILRHRLTADLISRVSGEKIPSLLVEETSTEKFRVRFDPSSYGAEVGDYDLELNLGPGLIRRLENAFRFAPLGAGNLKAQLIIPGQLGLQNLSTLYVEYENTGTDTMAAPILTLASSDPDGSDRPMLTLDPTRIFTGVRGVNNDVAVPVGVASSVQILASGAKAGVLQPGEKIRVPVYYLGRQKTWDLSDTITEFALTSHEAGDSTIVGWSWILPGLRPSSVPADLWNAMSLNFQSLVGATWGDYLEKLNSVAEHLSDLGQPTRDVSELLNGLIQQTIGRDPIGNLTTAVDASMPTSGLSLVFSRTYANDVRSRNEEGPFGFGWKTPWQVRLVPLTNGKVYIDDSQSTPRVFQQDRSQTKFHSAFGDPGILQQVSGGYELTEPSGLKVRFRSDGTLERMTDTNGNRISTTFSNGQLTRLTHSSGAFLDIAWNSVGRISSLTESTGQSKSFQYDSTGKYLVSTTGPVGTTVYEYTTSANVLVNRALTSVTRPQGVVERFEYDSGGRVIATDFGSVSNMRQTFTYLPSGDVEMSNSGGGTDTLSFNSRGQLLRQELADETFVRFEYNDRGQLIRKTDSSGRSVSYTRCECGRPTSVTDALGNKQLMALGGPNNAMTRFTDARGNSTRFEYNAAGDMTKQIYADGSFESHTFDAAGNPDVTTTRRGQTMDRTVNSSGQVTREVGSDGTWTNYVYTASGRLASVETADGFTTFQYDAADRMTRVQYPNGRWIQYDFDALGRRSRIEDHSGFVQKFSYDTAGRLHELRDGNDALLVRYSFDPFGNLSREDKGNGTHTLYGYDDNGRQTGIFNFNAGGQLNSQLLYTYDAQGRRISETSEKGVWIYSYDLIDQLVEAVFTSSIPAIPNQSLQYSYDATGNRTQTVVNGVGSTVQSNNLNQTTSVGNTTFVYDTGGNLIQEVSPAGTKTYTWDLRGRMTRVQSPQGTWEYEYDALGNRSAVVQNGVRTEFLVDPTGLGNVLGEYNANGSRSVGYVLGYGLEAQVGSSGTSFFEFDAVGSTRGLTGASGSYTREMTWDPFGGSLLSTGSETTRFGFVGAYGVQQDANGLTFMRNRYYSPGMGRFVSADPIGLRGGDQNLYRYAANAPTILIDPSGLWNDGSSFSGGSRSATLEDGLPQNKGLDLKEGEPSFILGCIISREVFCIDTCTGESQFQYGLSEHCKERDSDEDVFEDNNPDDDDSDEPDRPEPPEPPEPPSDPEDNKDAPTANSIDPNEKLGAAGYGPQEFIAAASLIPYSIHFENLGPGSVPVPSTPATAPAQRVEISDQLPMELDWSTFEFTAFGFGNEVFPLSAGQTFASMVVPTTINGQFFNVEVELSFDEQTGLLTALFDSIDPATQLPPDVLVGMLPPEDGTGIGQGYLSYSVRPKSTLVTGTELRNVALIRFDGQNSIATNQIDPQNPAAGTSPLREALNTIDAEAPVSQVGALPENSPSIFTVNWSGLDGSGSGVASYDVFVSVNGAEPALWLNGVATTQASYTGQPGFTYAFYSIARDNVGQLEAPPLVPDAITKINRAPTNVTLSATTVSENLPAGTVVGSLAATDPDPGNSFTFTLVSGSGSADNSSFVVTGNQLRTAAIFDFETKSSYSIRLRVTDQDGLSFEKAFAISVTNVFELQSFDVQRNESQRSFVQYLDLVFDDSNQLAQLLDQSRVRLFHYDEKIVLPGNITEFTGPNSNDTNGRQISLTGKTQRNGNSLTINFGTGGIGGNRNSGIGDGYYRFRLDLDKNGTFETSRSFYRLFGDVNGDRTVDTSDFNAVNDQIRSGLPYNAQLDVNRDGVVDARDLLIQAPLVGKKRLRNSLWLDD